MYMYKAPLTCSLYILLYMCGCICLNDFAATFANSLVSVMTDQSKLARWMKCLKLSLKRE